MNPCMKKIKLSLISFIIVLTFISIAQAAESKFELKPFSTPQSSSADIAAGIKNLYKNKISDAELEKLIGESQSFENELYSILNSQIIKQKTLTARTKEKRLTGGFVNEVTIEIDSLIQRPNNHASNKIVTKLYENINYRQFCDYKYPTSIMLHHIQDELDVIEKMAMVQASGIVSAPALVAVIHMPHYGLRKSGQEQFLTSDLSKVRQNIMQLILDVHVLKNYLETRTNVDTKNMNLAGISLGAVLGLTVGAFEQSFNRYTFMVGGADLANILMNRVRNRPDSEVAIAMKGVNFEENFLRRELAPIDSFTWMHKYQNKIFSFVNASRDDIVEFRNSVEPVYNILGKNNRLDTRINEDEHVPTGGVFTKLKNIVLPLAKGATKGTTTIEETCPDRNNSY